MQTRIFKKRIALVVGIAVALYILLHSRKQTVTYQTLIPKVNPKEVWDFVADFSNMKKLNPTIIDFDIIDESGNFDHWKYTAQYKEYLSHLPFIEHIAHGYFNVKPKGNHFIIESTHSTCFFFNKYCLNTDSEFLFLPAPSNGTECIEHIHYECPAIMSFLCKAEVMYQRKEIMNNLRNHFLRK